MRFRLKQYDVQTHVAAEGAPSYFQYGDLGITAAADVDQPKLEAQHLLRQHVRR